MPKLPPLKTMGIKSPAGKVGGKSVKGAYPGVSPKSGK